MADRLEMLRQMLSEDPNDPFLAYGIALEIAKTDPQSGIANLRDLTLNHPTYLPPYYRLGALLSELNREGEAVVYLQKGLELAKVQKETMAAREIQSLLDELSFE